MCPKAKPIKHGVKIWVLCDAETGYIYNFYVFTGKETSHSTSEDVILKGLLANAGLEGKGHCVVTDNWFSSRDLAKQLWQLFSMYFVGVHRMTTKTKKKEDDFQFRKLPASTQSYIDQGAVRQCFRQFPEVKPAVPTIDFDGPNKTFTMMCAVFKDKKLVGLLATAFLSLRHPDKEIVRRGRKGQSQRKEVSALMALIMYMRYMGAVDRADRGIADFTCSFRTSRWTTRIVMWCIDTITWNTWQVVIDRIVNSVFPGQQAYAQANDGAQLTDLYARYGKRVKGEGDDEWKFESAADGHYCMVRDVGKHLVRFARSEAEKEAKGKDLWGAFPWIPRRSIPKERRLSTGGTILKSPSNVSFETLHQSVVLAAGKKAKCVVCMMVAVKLGLASDKTDAKVQGLCKQEARRCDECNMQICKYCHENNWDHQYAVLKASPSLAPKLREKVGKRAAEGGQGGRANKRR